MSSGAAVPVEEHREAEGPDAVELRFMGVINGKAMVYDERLGGNIYLSEGEVHRGMLVTEIKTTRIKFEKGGQEVTLLPGAAAPGLEPIAASRQRQQWKAQERQNRINQYELELKNQEPHPQPDLTREL